jgi:hypothetical protein
MPDATRRTFLAAAGSGAATTAAVIAAPSALADSAAGPSDAETATQRLVAHVEDPASGRVTIMWGEDEVTINDIALVRRLARAVRS